MTTYTYTKAGRTKKVVEKDGSGKKIHDATSTCNAKDQEIKYVYNYYRDGKKSRTDTRTYTYYKNGYVKKENYVSSDGSRSAAKYNQDGYIVSYVSKWEDGKETEYYTNDELKEVLYKEKGNDEKKFYNSRKAEYKIYSRIKYIG